MSCLHIEIELQKNYNNCMEKYNGRIIDLHSHFNTGGEYDCPETLVQKRNMSHVKLEYDNSGIVAGVFCPYTSVMQSNDGIYNDNQSFHELSLKTDWVYQWIVLDPRQEELFWQIERLISKEKILGIKIHSPCHGYDINEYGDKIFSFANKLKCFVLSHPDNLEDMSHMVNFADKYPNMNLILAHLGTEAYVDAIISAKHQNIYTDTSGSASNKNYAIEYGVEQIGSEKILFGTDSYSCAFQRGRIDYADITQEDKENILYKNALKLFPMMNDIFNG